MDIYYRIDPREEKLPKWAQDHLNMLRASMRRMQEALEYDTSDANTFLQCSHPIQDEPLGKDKRIVFKTKSKFTWGNEFTVHLEDDELNIRAASTLALVLQSSNCFKVRMQER